MPVSSERTGMLGFAAVHANPRTNRRPLLACCHREIVEMHVAVCLRPQADLSGDGLWQRVLKVELAVEIAFYLVAGDADFQVVPLAGCCRCVANPFHRRAPALFELPKYEIVFQAIRPDGQVVAIGLQVEEYTGALIDAARQAFEPYRDLPILEVFDVLGHNIRVIGISLDAIEKFRVTLAVKRARLVGDAGGGLSLLPLPAV